MTNRHALDFETENGENLQSVKIRIRDDPEDLDQFEEKTVLLRDDENTRKWLSSDPRVDLALIPLTPDTLDESIDIHNCNFT